MHRAHRVGKLHLPSRHGVPGLGPHEQAWPPAQPQVSAFPFIALPLPCRHVAVRYSEGQPGNRYYGGNEARLCGRATTSTGWISASQYPSMKVLKMPSLKSLLLRGCWWGGDRVLLLPLLTGRPSQ